MYNTVKLVYRMYKVILIKLAIIILKENLQKQKVIKRKNTTLIFHVFLYIKLTDILK